ncbi:CLUMA_CG017345, isoform A, partial [Clunio marinus]
AQLKIFGCYEFYLGAKIIALISIIENLVKVVVSVIFIIWASTEQQSRKLNKEMNHAKVYVLIGIIGFIFSSLLIIGISRNLYRRMIPWICFQIGNICYQVYFSFEVIKSSRYENLNFSTMIILMIFIFHIIFESYYLCLIIGLSQIVANIKLMTVKESLNIQNVPMTSLECGIHAKEGES